MARTNLIEYEYYEDGTYLKFEDGRIFLIPDDNLEASCLADRIIEMFQSENNAHWLRENEIM